MKNSAKDYDCINYTDHKSNKTVKKRKKFKVPSYGCELVAESFLCSPSHLTKTTGIDCLPSVDESSTLTSVLKKKNKKRVKSKQSNYKLPNTSSLALDSSCESFSPSVRPSRTPTSNFNDSSMVEENLNPRKKRKKTSSALCNEVSEHSSDGKSKSNIDQVNGSSSSAVIGELDTTQDSESDIDHGKAKQSISIMKSNFCAKIKSDNTRTTFESLGNDDVGKARSKSSLNEEEISQLALSLSLKYKKTIGGAGYTRSTRLSRCRLGPFEIIKSGIPHVSSNMLPLEVFIYKPKFTWTQSDERKADERKWFKRRRKKGVRCTIEEIEQDMKEKIENIAEHFKRFCDGSLDEDAIPVKEMNKVNFYSPYLPTYRELHLLQTLDFSEEFDDSEVDDDDQEGYLLDSEDEDDLCDDDVLIRRELQIEQQSKDYNRGTFSDRERKRVLKNWQNFQMKYKFYDLRPLLSLRTCMLEGNAEHFELHKLHYISSLKQKQFLSILGKGLNRNYIQILYHARSALLMQTSFPPRCRHEGFSDWDVHLIDYFVQRYGVDCIAMEFINHSLNRNGFCNFLIKHYRYQLCPIRQGRFSRMEIVRLMNAVLQYVADKPGIQRTSVAGIFATPIRWGKVFEGVKTRTPMQCCSAFHSVVKQALQLRHHKRTCSDGEDKISWTSRHELLLLKELCKSPAVHLNTVDFYSISRLEEFTPFCDDFLKRTARDLIAAKVPPDHRLNLDEALDYLSRRVLPVLERKAEHDKALRTDYLDKAHQLEGIIPDYLDKFIFEVFSTQPIYDEEEQDESLPNYSTSLFSNTRL